MNLTRVYSTVADTSGQNIPHVPKVPIGDIKRCAEVPIDPDLHWFSSLRNMSVTRGD